MNPVDPGVVVNGVLYQKDGGLACPNAVTVFGTASECTPATCSDGCCDGTRCIRTCAQSGARCGVYAEACVSCAGTDACDRGACRGTGPCAGCRNTELCNSGTLNSLCGGPSTGCTLCESCVNRQCVSPPVRVGDPCASDNDCAVMGRGAYCRLQTVPGGQTYPGGFCTFPCAGTYSACSSSSECVSFPTRFGERDRLCVPSCNQRGDAGFGCRADYTCYSGLAWGGASVCWIAPPPAAVVTAPIGSPCLADDDCGSGRRCLRPFVGSAINGYWGGYCTSTCTPGATCGSGNDVCIGEIFPTPVGDATVNGCKAACSAPGFQAECRTEYTCQGSASGSWCAPRCGWRSCPSGQTCNTLTGVCG